MARHDALADDPDADGEAATLKRVVAALFVVAAVTGGIAAAHADPGPGPGMCMYLGANYDTWYPCLDPPAWLPYGQGGNPPYGSSLPPSDCAPPNQHNEGCS